MRAILDFLFHLFDCDLVSEDDNETEIEANAMVSMFGVTESLKDH